MKESRPDVEVGGVFTVTINRAFDVTASDEGVTIHTPHAAFILPLDVTVQVVEALGERAGDQIRALTGQGA